MVLEGKTEARHNHRRCVKQALDSAHRVCEVNGSRLTDLRRRVLEHVWRGHDAVKAYDILAGLGEGERAAKPPTVYRALHFLRELGLVHKLESLNAFVGCSEPMDAHEGWFLICSLCGTVRELRRPSVARLVSESAGRVGFRVERQTIEIHGTCSRCQEGTG